MRIAVKTRELGYRREVHREGPRSGSHMIDAATGCFWLTYFRGSESKDQDVLGTTKVAESGSGF